jgi:hypothetical protein
MRYYEIADRPRAQTATDRITRDEPRHLQHNAGRIWPSGGSLRVSDNTAKAKPYATDTDNIPEGCSSSRPS